MTETTHEIAGQTATFAPPSPLQLDLDSSTLGKLGELALAAKAIQTHEGTAHLVLPPEHRHVDLTAVIEQAAERPNRKRGTIQLLDLDSFLTYVKQQGDPASTYIYADVDSRTLTAVFNEHTPLAHAGHPGWRDHRAVYTAALSPEFATWSKNDRQPMEQEPFAIFIEDNIADVIEPAGTVLLEVASSLQAKTDVNFSAAKRLDNGQVQFVYQENTQATAGGGSIDIPREFVLGMRLFKGAAGYRLKARLKYRLGGGKLKFWYELDRPHLAIEAAFNEYVQQARSGAYTLLLGKA
jgi:uncharacterized protein YfdQ (DUF2303 family)